MAVSLRVMHAVDMSATLERAVASLAAHRAYLAALGDEQPERQARAFAERVAVAFDLLGG